MGTTDIAQLIRHERKRQHLTLEDLAERVGMTPGALSHIETGRRLPSASNAVAIAQALRVDEETMLDALDEALKIRRYDSITTKSKSAKPRSASAPRAVSSIEAPSGFTARSVFDLGSPEMSEPSYPSDVQFLRAATPRNRARWSDDTPTRLAALDDLADTAADAIRTLRGLLDDEDPHIRREARRLLRELDVRMPEE